MMPLGTWELFLLTILWGMHPELKFLFHTLYGASIFNFIWNRHTIFHHSCRIYIPTNMLEKNVRMSRSVAYDRHFKRSTSKIEEFKTMFSKYGYCVSWNICLKRFYSYSPTRKCIPNV